MISYNISNNTILPLAGLLLLIAMLLERKPKKGNVEWIRRTVFPEEFYESFSVKKKFSAWNIVITALIAIFGTAFCGIAGAGLNFLQADNCFIYCQTAVFAAAVYLSVTMLSGSGLSGILSAVFVFFAALDYPATPEIFFAECAVTVYLTLTFLSAESGACFIVASAVLGVGMAFYPPCLPFVMVGIVFAALDKVSNLKRVPALLIAVLAPAAVYAGVSMGLYGGVSVSMVSVTEITPDGMAVMAILSLIACIVYAVKSKSLAALLTVVCLAAAAICTLFGFVYPAPICLCAVYCIAVLAKKGSGKAISAASVAAFLAILSFLSNIYLEELFL